MDAAKSLTVSDWSRDGKSMVFPLFTSPTLLEYHGIILLSMKI